MKRILTFITACILLLSITSPTYAASTGHLPIKSKKATLKIEEGEISKLTKLEISLREKDVYVGSSMYNHYPEVIAHYENGMTEYVSEIAKLSSSNTKVIKVSNGYLNPVGKGKAEIKATYKGKTAKTTVTVQAAPKGAITFVTASAKEKITSLNFYYQDKYGKGSKDYSYRHLDLKKTGSKNGEFKVSGINWSKTPEIQAVVTTNTHSYMLTLKKSQNGKKVKLDGKNYVEFTVKTPYKNFKAETISISTTDKNGIKMYAGTFYYPKTTKFYLPKGTYSFQITGNDGKNYHQFYKINEKLTSKKALSISTKDVSLVKLKINKKTKNTLALTSLNAHDWKNFNSLNSIDFNKKNLTAANVYLSKFTYQNMGVNVLVNNKWTYGFSFGEKKISKNTSLTIGDELTADLQFNSNMVFRAGQRIYLDKKMSDWSYGSFTLTDTYGNSLQNIYGDKGSVKGNFVFKNGKKTFKVPVSYFGSASFPLPTEAGTYEVTFELAK